MEPLLHLDEQQSAFFVRALSVVQRQVYETTYPQIKNRTLVPVNTSLAPGTQYVIYYTYDKYGMAKIRAGYGDDIPRVDLKGSENFSRVRTLHDAYGWDVDEIEAAALQGMALDSAKAAVAKEAMYRLEQRLCFLGDSRYNMVGFLNHPNVPLYVLPADGTGSTTTFLTKTPAQVLRDLNGFVNSVSELTLENEAPDTLLLPTVLYNLLNSTPWSTTGDGKSILRQFLDSNSYIKQVESLPFLKGAGAGGLDRMVAYRRSPEVLEQQIPLDFKQEDMEQRNMEKIIPCRERYGGVTVYRPLAIVFADGI